MDCSRSLAKMTPREEVEGSTPYDEREEDLFTAIGKRVQDLEIDDTARVKRFDEENETEDDRAEAKVVDKIESLCMNCEDNVNLALSHYHFHAFISHSRKIRSIC